MNDEENTQSKTGLNVPYIILNPMGTMGKKAEQEFLYLIRRIRIIRNTTRAELWQTAYCATFLFLTYLLVRSCILKGFKVIFGKEI
jgi:hypothetical protein